MDASPYWIDIDTAQLPFLSGIYRLMLCCQFFLYFSLLCGFWWRHYVKLVCWPKWAGTFLLPWWVFFTLCQKSYVPFPFKLQNLSLHWGQHQVVTDPLFSEMCPLLPITVVTRKLWLSGGWAGLSSGLLSASAGHRLQGGWSKFSKMVRSYCIRDTLPKTAGLSLPYAILGEDCIRRATGFL